jgi:hypothetical protein
MNDESKVRRSTKSEILAKGEGKVMSYEDLEEARVKRAEKEAAKAKGKGKRGPKPKSTAPEEASANNAKRGRKRKSAEAEPDARPESARTKVARMSEASEPSMGMIRPSGPDDRPSCADEKCRLRKMGLLLKGWKSLLCSSARIGLR